MRFDRVAQSIAAGAVAVTVLLAVATPAHGAAGFGDVAAGRFYAKPVQWMVDKGITTGTAPGCFSPDRRVTRAELATFLHRYAGQPASGSEPFVDVSNSAYYRDAVAWMAQTGITTGTSATTFSPNRHVTRGEVATFMHRFAGSPAPATAYSSAPPFGDTPASAFFTTAVKWMVATGITTGTSPTTFEPYRVVSRGEVATFLYRLAGSPNVTLDPGGTCGPPVASDVATAEAVSLQLLNQLRASVGVAPLTRVASMDQFARDWSRSMSVGGVFTHSAGPYGENIVWWSDASLSPEQAAQRFHQMWVDSAGHYKNMTLADYSSVGVGLWHDENGWHGTHVFAY